MADLTGTVNIDGGGGLRVVGIPPEVGRIYGGGSLVVLGLRNQLFEDVWFDSELVQGVVGPSPLWRPDRGY